MLQGVEMKITSYLDIDLQYSMILSNLSSRYHWSACNPSADLPAPSVGRASDSNL